MSKFDISAYLGVFLEEVDEQLQILNEEVLNLERDGTNQETIGHIFRAAHTLKGSSAAMGFDKMKDLTHRVESVFDLIRNQQLKVNTEIINVIFETIDHIKTLKEAIISGIIDKVDISHLSHQLSKIQDSANCESSNRSEIIQEKNPSDELSFPEITLDVYQKDIIKSAIRSGYKVMAVHVGLIKEALLKSVRAFLIHNNLKEIGDIIASFPTTDAIENEEIFEGNLVFIIITHVTKQEVINIVNSISDIRTVNISQINEANLDSYCQGRKMEFGFKKTPEETTIIRNDETRIKVQQTVRVDVERLEHLMNLVGELVIGQTRLADIRGHLSDRHPHDPDMESFSEVGNHIGQVVSDLQEEMMKTRMLPIEQLFNRFPRMVRDLCQKANKEVDFIIEGKETELDRNLIEEISDPIIHLLRNSIDHGIEDPDERVRLGKTRKGQVILKASHEENHIVITISDDGSGIDPNKIRAIALKKDLVSEEVVDRMTEKDLIFLIFKSGFSTAPQVTDISGRGVGMDIVRSHIEKLNGIVDIETKSGEGTIFTIKLPLTLAIIRSLLVSLGKKEFAIPLANVQEIVRLNIDDIKTIKNQEVGLVRDRVLPLVKMHKRLGADEVNLMNKKRIFVVVVGLADKRVGIIVDETLGNQEIVIKPLGKYIGTPKYVAGATIMGDGNVALILDAGAIIREEGTKDFAHQETDHGIAKRDEKIVELATFKLGSEEYGIGIELVKEIITVPTITKFINAPFSVLGMVNLRGKLIPVMDLRQRFDMRQYDQTSKSRVIVVEFSNHLIGILVDQVTQVLKVAKDTIDSTLENISRVEAKYIKGISNRGGRLVILLDLDLVLNINELMQLTKITEVQEQKI